MFGRTPTVEGSSSSTLPPPPAPVFRLKRTLAGVGKGVLCLAFSPDGGVLASGGYDGVIRVWDIAAGRSILDWDSGQDVLHSVVFSPDGRLLASAGRGGVVRCWDARTGAPLGAAASARDATGIGRLAF
jgi:WD40 repeat protein